MFFSCSPFFLCQPRHAVHNECCALGRHPILFFFFFSFFFVSLDIQYIMSVAPSVATQFWYTAGKQPHNPGAEPFIEFLAALSDTADEEVRCLNPKPGT
jgi:hypothetical protein